MKTRVYVVTVGKEERMVRAANQAAALRYVASQTMTVKVPSQNELIELVKASVEIEEAPGRVAAD